MSPAAASPLLLDLFARRSRSALARHFQGVRLSRAGALPAMPGERPGSAPPLVVYCNHPSWWDPLVGLVLAQELLAGRRHFAALEADQLARRRLLARIGFFGVERGTVAGARRFLDTARSLLATAGAVLWISPQATACDPRQRPPRLEAGLGHLARDGRGRFAPLALEYPYWGSRLPEALARFGEPLEAAEVQGWPPAEITEVLADRLAAAQDALAAEAIDRDAAAFRHLLDGGTGASGVYGRLRAAAARWRGGRGTAPG